MHTHIYICISHYQDCIRDNILQFFERYDLGKTFRILIHLSLVFVGLDRFWWKRNRQKCYVSIVFLLHLYANFCCLPVITERQMYRTSFKDTPPAHRAAPHQMNPHWWKLQTEDEEKLQAGSRLFPQRTRRDIMLHAPCCFWWSKSKAQQEHTYSRLSFPTMSLFNWLFRFILIA